MSPHPFELGSLPTRHVDAALRSHPALYVRFARPWDGQDLSCRKEKIGGRETSSCATPLLHSGMLRNCTNNLCQDDRTYHHPFNIRGR
ncbi:Uncharacterised protein [Vibrio cholerae]|nr:Uncharacterised protein [Vibrio cholerae]